MNRSFLGKAAFRIGIANWIFFVITVVVFLLTMNDVLNNSIPDWIQVIIILIFFLTLFSGFTSFIGILFAYVDYRKLDNNNRNFITNLALNLSYFLLYILLVKVFYNGIFDAIMSV